MTRTDLPGLSAPRPPADSIIQVAWPGHSGGPHLSPPSRESIWLPPLPCRCRVARGFCGLFGDPATGGRLLTNLSCGPPRGRSQRVVRADERGKSAPHRSVPVQAAGTRTQAAGWHFSPGVPLGGGLPSLCAVSATAAAGFQALRGAPKAGFAGKYVSLQHAGKLSRALQIFQE